jgi:hypothetical protein
LIGVLKLAVVRNLDNYAVVDLFTHSCEHTLCCYRFLAQVLDGCIKQKKKENRGGTSTKKGKCRCNNTA